MGMPAVTIVRRRPNGHRKCAQSRRGSNADVYASGTPVYQAYGRRDWSMVKLLERHGGLPMRPWRVSIVRRNSRSSWSRERQASRCRMGCSPASHWAKNSCGRGLAAAIPRIVRMALELVDWPRDDPRWFGILEQPLRIWNHGSGHSDNNGWDRGTYVTCFRLN